MSAECGLKQVLRLVVFSGYVFYFSQANSIPACTDICSCYKVLTKTDVDEEDDDEDTRSDEERLRVFL